MLQQHQKSKLPQTTIVQELPMRTIAEQHNQSVKVAEANRKQLKESTKNQNASSFEERLRVFKTSAK